MFLLCVSYMTFSWYKFDQNPLSGIQHYDQRGDAMGCSASKLEDYFKHYEVDQGQICGGLAATGVIATIAAITALFGGCSKNAERNIATVSAAMGLLCLANALDNLNKYDFNSCSESGEGMYSKCGAWLGSGIVWSVGAICGLLYAMLTCCREKKTTNNLFFLGSIFFFALGLAIVDWQAVDGEGCKIEGPSKEQLEEGNQCTTYVFKGLFDAAVLVLVLLAAFLQFCKGEKLQPGPQYALIALSLGCLMVNYFATFWYQFGLELVDENGHVVAKCAKEAEMPNGKYCTTMVIGGLQGILGVPLTILTALFFLCGAVSDDDKESGAYSGVDYGTTGNTGNGLISV